jgi:predicted transcriptional regulator
MASRISVFFAMIIVFTGFIHMIEGNVVGGIWWVLIGSFLFSASNASYQSLVIKQSFAGKSVREFMNPSPVSVPSSITLQAFVDDYLYHYHYKMFPVTHQDEFSGFITLKVLKSIPHEEWQRVKVSEVAQKLSPGNTLPATTPVQNALRIMNESGISRMLVTDKGKVIGMITLKDLLEFFTLKMELER